MSYLYQALKKKERELLLILENTGSPSADLPPGTLDITTVNGNDYYYHRFFDEEQKRFRKKYIPRKNQELARQLAQRSYNNQAASAAGQLLHAVQAMLRDYPSDQPEIIWNRMSKARRKLVTPLALPLSERIAQWESQPVLSSNPFPIEGELYTARGEHVRSKSEVMLADQFYHHGIPYKYEVPLILQDGSRGPVSYPIFPDFTLLNRSTGRVYYWEHLGMMDSKDYVEDAIRKIERYEMNGIFPGIQLILTYETSSRPLNSKAVEALIRRFLL